MYSNLMVGFLAAVGLGGWVFSKFQRSTGGNTKSSLTAAALCGGLAWLVVTVILGLIF